MSPPGVEEGRRRRERRRGRRCRRRHRRHNVRASFFLRRCIRRCDDDIVCLIHDTIVHDAVIHVSHGIIVPWHRRSHHLPPVPSSMPWRRCSLSRSYRKKGEAVGSLMMAAAMIMELARVGGVPIHDPMLTALAVLIRRVGVWCTVCGVCDPAVA